MATYKIQQDVEAEDKIIGPLTLRQFIYMIIVALGLWGTIQFAQSTFTMFLIPLTLLPSAFFGLLVFLGIKNPSQPAELYLAAIVRFYFKTHRRIWNQEGVLETVKINAPKKELHQYSDNLSRGEVRSRLANLANVMDSRGWAARGPGSQAQTIMPQTSQTVTQIDDRLVALPQIQVDPSDVHPQDDIMNATANTVAQNFDAMIHKQEEVQRQQAIAHMKDPNFNPYPAMHQKMVAPIDDTGPTQTTDEPGGQNQPPPPQPSQPPAAQPPPPSEKIMQLVQEAGDNLSVQTLANEAERVHNLQSGDEISLH